MAFPPTSVAAAAAAAALATAEFIKTTSQATGGSSISSNSSGIPDDFHHLIGGHNLDGVVSNCYHSMSLLPSFPAATSGQRTTSLPGHRPGQVPLSPCPSTSSSPAEQQFEASGGPPILANGIVKRDFDDGTDSGGAPGEGALTAFPGVGIGHQGTAAVADNYLDNFQSNFPSLDAFLGELNAVQSGATTSQDRELQSDRSGINATGSTCLRVPAGGFRSSKSAAGAGGLRSSSFTIESIMRK